MKRTLLTYLFLITSILLSAQNTPFELRLIEIEKELGEKAANAIPGLQDPVNFDISSAPIQEFMGIIAAAHNLNISVSPNLNILVTNRFFDAKVQDILLFMCKQHELDITFLNNIISIQKYVPKEILRPVQIEKDLDIRFNETNQTVSLNLENDSLKLFTRQFTNKTGYNVIYGSDVRNAKISAFMKNTDPIDALDQIAFSNNLLLTNPRENLFLFDKTGSKNNKQESSGLKNKNNRSRNEELSFEIEEVGTDLLISASSFEVPLREVINEIFIASGKEYFLIDELQESITMNTSSMNFDSFLSYLLKATNYTFRNENGTYLIGKRDAEGLRSAKVVKLKFRSAEEIDAFIPESMKTGVQISVFQELNAVILSGSTPQIEEITTFLNQIDEPVPNVLIEVIVVDVREGYSIQTGFNAILTDSANAPKSSGRIFPGVDVTLGTDAINNALERLSKTNVVKMGKVTPRFYATLKALEDNNDIDIRSTPQLATLNGHEATLKIGESVFFVQQTQAINPGVNPITTISQQFRQVEANLSILIKPVVSGNEHVTLAIDAEFSNFIPPEFENAPPGNATRRFTSMVRVQNEEMIVLGGLEEVSKSESNSGVPLLSRIPILKWIFSSKSNSKSHNRLVIFIKPSIVF